MIQSLSEGVHGTVLAAGLVDILKEMFEEARILVVMAMVLMGIVFVIMTWTRTRSLMPTLGAMLLGLLVVWGVTNYVWLADRAGETVEDTNNNAGEDSGIDLPETAGE